MRLIAAALLVLVGITLALSGLTPGFVLAVAGVALCPSEDQEQARARRVVRLAMRRSHGFGECSGFDCRL